MRYIYKLYIVFLVSNIFCTKYLLTISWTCLRLGRAPHGEVCINYVLDFRYLRVDIFHVQNAIRLSPQSAKAQCRKAHQNEICLFVRLGYSIPVVP